MKVIAILPQGLEKEGAKELLELGATAIKVSLRSVSFEASVATFYRVHLYARLPFRFLREITQFSCNSPDSLYRGIQRACNWEEWLDPSKSFCVDVTGKSDRLNHTYFTALKVKNAIIDLQREVFGQRSFVDLEDPDCCIHLHVSNDIAALSFATTRRSLHKRGYRPFMGEAPLKENIAAGLIRMTNWDSSLPLIDPLCGSATFLIEAVSIALNIPHGLNRSFLFKSWPDFDYKAWEYERNNAQRLSDKIIVNFKVFGCEENESIALHAKKNVSLAGLENLIQIDNKAFKDFDLPKEKGIVVCNPPYGKRIGNEEELYELYKQLGYFLKANASGWQFWLLNGNPNLSKALRMKAIKKFPINNGGIDCRWMHYPVN